MTLASALRLFQTVGGNSDWLNDGSRGVSRSSAIDVVTESKEQRGRDQLVEQGGRQHPAEDDEGQRVENLLAGLARSEYQGQQADEARRCGHHHRGEAFQAASNNHRFAELFAFVLHEVDVVRDHDDAVAAGGMDRTARTDRRPAGVGTGNS